MKTLALIYKAHRLKCRKCITNDFKESVFKKDFGGRIFFPGLYFLFQERKKKFLVHTKPRVTL